MSSHVASAFVSAASALRRSAGRRCTTPSEIRAVVIEPSRKRKDHALDTSVQLGFRDSRSTSEEERIFWGLLPDRRSYDWIIRNSGMVWFGFKVYPEPKCEGPGAPTLLCDFSIPRPGPPARNEGPSTLMPVWLSNAVRLALAATHRTSLLPRTLAHLSRAAAGGALCSRPDMVPLLHFSGRQPLRIRDHTPGRVTDWADRWLGAHDHWAKRLVTDRAGRRPLRIRNRKGCFRFIRHRFGSRKTTSSNHIVGTRLFHPCSPVNNFWAGVLEPECPIGSGIVKSQLVWPSGSYGLARLSQSGAVWAFWQWGWVCR